MCSEVLELFTRHFSGKKKRKNFKKMEVDTFVRVARISCEKKRPIEISIYIKGMKEIIIIIIIIIIIAVSPTPVKVHQLTLVIIIIIIIFTNPSARAECDTRSIFKRSLTGLNSEFSF